MTDRGQCRHCVRDVQALAMGHRAATGQYGTCGLYTGGARILLRCASCDGGRRPVASPDSDWVAQGQPIREPKLTDGGAINPWPDGAGRLAANREKLPNAVL